MSFAFQIEREIKKNSTKKNTNGPAYRKSIRSIVIEYIQIEKKTNMRLFRSQYHLPEIVNSNSFVYKSMPKYDVYLV